MEIKLIHGAQKGHPIAGTYQELVPGKNSFLSACTEMKKKSKETRVTFLRNPVTHQLGSEPQVVNNWT